MYQLRVTRLIELWRGLLLCSTIWLYASPAAGLQAAVLSPVDAVVLERAHGQTSDLDWELVEVPGPPQLARALRVAREKPVDAVIWLEPNPDGGFQVFVLEPRARRQLERTVSPPQQEALASSTTAELAAFVIRSALQAIGEGRQFGEPIRQPPAPAEPVVVTPAPPERAGWVHALSLEAAAFVVAQGPQLWLQPGVSVGITFAPSSWSLGVVATTTGQSQLDFDRGRLGLQRQQLGGSVGLRVVDSRPFDVWLRLASGVLVYRRETLAVDAGFSATAQAFKLSPYAAPEILVTWRPWRSDWLALLLAPALEIVPGSPTLAYRLSTRTIDDRSLLWIQPRLLLGIDLRWPRP